MEKTARFVFKRDDFVIGYSKVNTKFHFMDVKHNLKCCPIVDIRNEKGKPILGALTFQTENSIGLAIQDEYFIGKEFTILCMG